MGLYEPKSCCICFDTKNGSLILASLTLIYSILNILNAVSGQLALTMSVVWDQMAKDRSMPPEYQQYKDTIILYAVIITLAWNGLLVTLSSLLIHGVRKDRPGLMLPFLAWSWTRLVMECLCGVLVTGVAFYTTEPVIFIATVLVMIFISIDAYFVLVINAYHKQVKRSLSEDHQLLREEFDNDNFDYKVKV